MSDSRAAENHKAQTPPEGESDADEPMDCSPPKGAEEGDADAKFDSMEVDDPESKSAGDGEDVEADCGAENDAPDKAESNEDENEDDKDGSGEEGNEDDKEGSSEHENETEEQMNADVNLTESTSVEPPTKDDATEDDKAASDDKDDGEAASSEIDSSRPRQPSLGNCRRRTSSTSCLQGSMDDSHIRSGTAPESFQVLVDMDLLDSSHQKYKIDIKPMGRRRAYTTSSRRSVSDVYVEDLWAKPGDYDSDDEDAAAESSTRSAPRMSAGPGGMPRMGFGLPPAGGASMLKGLKPAGLRAGLKSSGGGAAPNFGAAAAAAAASKKAGAAKAASPTPQQSSTDAQPVNFLANLKKTAKSSVRSRSPSPSRGNSLFGSSKPLSPGNTGSTSNKTATSSIRSPSPSIAKNLFGSSKPLSPGNTGSTSNSGGSPASGSPFGASVNRASLKSRNEDDSSAKQTAFSPNKASDTGVPFGTSTPAKLPGISKSASTSPRGSIADASGRSPRDMFGPRVGAGSVNGKSPPQVRKGSWKSSSPPNGEISSQTSSPFDKFGVKSRGAGPKTRNGQAENEGGEFVPKFQKPSAIKKKNSVTPIEVGSSVAKAQTVSSSPFIKQDSKNTLVSPFLKQDTKKDTKVTSPFLQKKSSTDDIPEWKKQLLHRRSSKGKEEVLEFQRVALRKAS